ncbi:MAG: zinc-ribbon domain-containing protein [Asticcacaulis sp.]
MILSCPSCSTQYAIDDAQLGPAGRTVRCSACKTTWRAERAEDPIELPPVVESPPARPEDLKTVKAEKLPKSYRAMQDYKKRMKALAAQGMVWGGLAASFALVLALGYFMRVNIVQMFPRTAGAYAMVGVRVNASNLDFMSYTATKTVRGGRFVVTVKAQIRNLSDKTVPVPPVRVKLMDATLQTFDTSLMPSSGLVMAPRAVRTVTFDVPDPKNLTSALDLGFDLVAMKSMKAARIASAEPATAAPVQVAAAGSETAALDTAPLTPDVPGPVDVRSGGLDSDAPGTAQAMPSQTPLSPPVLRPALSQTPDAADDTARHAAHGQS